MTRGVRALGWTLVVLSAAALAVLWLLDTVTVLHTRSALLLIAATFIPWIWLPMLTGLAGLAIALRGGLRLIAIGVLVATSVFWLTRGFHDPDPKLDQHEPDFTLAVLNVQYGGASVEDFIAEVAASDVVVVIEYTPGFELGLERAGFFEEFPHRVGSVREDAGGTMILARTPLTEIERLDTGFDNILVESTIDGATWRIAGIHAVPPHYRADAWASDGEKIRDMVARHDDGRLLLAGDFNAIEQHHIMRELDGVTNAMAGPSGVDAWRPTWPVHDVVPPFARIDHVLHSDDVTMPRPVTFEVPGTDHLGLVVHPAAS